MADKLSYEQFKEWILENYKSMLPADMQSYVAHVQTVEKLGGTYEGMSFLPDPKPAQYMAAQLNLSEVYKAYLDSSLDIKKTVGTAIFDVLNAKRPNIQLDDFKKNFFNYDLMKTKLFMKVVNYERNRELVDNSPHRLLQDLAVTYYLQLDVGEGNMASTRVTADLMDRWGINLDELQADAEVYHKKNMEPVFEPLGRHMMNSEMFPEELGTPPFVDDPPYILTTKGGHLGASEIACPDILENIGNQIGDFTIIPSSIHELLIMPDSMGMLPVDILGTVEDVNNTQVPPNEILSYNVYHYDAVENELTMIGNDSIDHDNDYDVDF